MVPQLKTLCGVKVVVLLCSHPDVKDRIFNTLGEYFEDEEKEIMKELKADLQIKLSNMLNSLPPNLVNFIPFDLGPFIGKEMIRYADLLESKFDLTEEFGKNFIKYSIFGSNGTIDEEVAARELLKDQNLDIFDLFKVACYYCLEDVIVILWENNRILKERFNYMCDLNESELKFLQYLEEKEKYSKGNVNVNNSNFNILSRFLFELLSSAIKYNSFSAFKYVWKTVDRSKEFQNFGEYTGHKCIAVFNKFCEEWISELCQKIKDALQCITPSQFYPQFYNYGNLLKFIISQMTTEEIKDFLSNFNALYTIKHCILFIFLHWPYHDLFMDMAESLFCILSKDEYYGLMHNFADLINCGNYTPYNYRLLLREFWIKSPLHLKKHFITLEQIETLSRPNWICFSRTTKILEQLILYCYFTPDDEYNFKMILQTATQQEKNNIFKFQGKRICDSLISEGDMKLTDFFLNSLNVDGETQQSLKKDSLIKKFREVMKSQNINLITQLIKWAVGSGEDKTIKQEIFSKWFEFNNIAHLCMALDIDVAFLDDIFKLFLNKDEIAEWKKNRAFDIKFIECLMCEYYDNARLDKFLKWICYTEEEISETKENMLLIMLENGLCLYKPDEEFVAELIFCLCSNNKEKIFEFVITLLAILETYAEKNTCQHCDNSENVYFDKILSTFRCRVHYYGVITFETVDHIHSYFIKELNSFDARCKKEGNKYKTDAMKYTFLASKTKII